MLSSWTWARSSPHWNELTSEEQNAFSEAAEAASDYAWDLYEKQLDADVDFMKEHGLTVTELSEEDRGKMLEKIQPVYDYLNSQYEWVDSVREMVSNIK